MYNGILSPYHACSSLAVPARFACSSPGTRRGAIDVYNAMDPRVRVRLRALTASVGRFPIPARARDIPLYGCITGNPLHPDIVGTVGTLYIKRSVLKIRSIFDSSELQTPQKRPKSTTVGPRGTAPRVPENRVEDRDTGHKGLMPGVRRCCQN